MRVRFEGLAYAGPSCGFWICNAMLIKGKKKTVSD